MSMLQSQLKGVEPESPSGDEPELDHDGDLDTDPSGDPPAGDDPIKGAPADGDPDPDDPKGKQPKGRTIDNVYRELIRRQDQAQEKMMATFTSTVENLVATLKPAQAPTSANEADDASKLSIAQLKSMRATTKPEQREALEDYIREREIDATVQSKVSQAAEKSAALDSRRTANQMAVNTYPHLTDPTSNFAKAVNSELARRGQSWVNQNPMAVLDAANAVAARQGTGLTGPRTPRVPNSAPNGGRHNRPAPASDKGELSMSEEEAAQIASKLQRALPPGKKFDLKKMRENSQVYRDNSHILIKG